MTLYDIATYADISQVVNDTNYAKSKGLIVKKQDDLIIETSQSMSPELSSAAEELIKEANTEENK